MDKKTLVDADIQEGLALLKALRSDRSLPISDALWLYSPDDAFWRLVIASPTVSELGPHEAYLRLQNALSRHSIRLDLSDIAVVEPRNSVIAALEQVLPPNGRRTDLRVTRESFGSLYIDDAYVYRPPRVAATRPDRTAPR